MEVKIVNKSRHRLPEYETPLSAGMDLKADISEPYKLLARGSIVIPTGLYISLPDGYEATIRSRSGLAFKYDVTAFHGLIDADYRGCVIVALKNTSDELQTIEHGERIAQLIVQPYYTVKFNEVESIGTTARGDAGFGSTGSH